MIRIATIFIICLFVVRSVLASFVWMSAKAFLEQSDLIAVVDVSQVHEVTTPEGFRLQSANAKIIREIYWRWQKDVPLERDLEPVVIYSFDPNAAITDKNTSCDGSAFPIHEGKAFVCLKMKGVNKFCPYDPLGFQLINNSEKVSWPSEPSYRPGMILYSLTPLQTVIDQLNVLQKGKYSEPDTSEKAPRS